MRQVSRTTFGALKNVKFRLSQNSMKFDVIARFRETIPTVKPVSSSEIKKFILDFDRNYYFTLLSKIRIFRGFTPYASNCWTSAGIIQGELDELGIFDWLLTKIERNEKDDLGRMGTIISGIWNQQKSQI